MAVPQALAGGPMRLDLADPNVTMPLVFVLCVGCLTTCIVTKDCNDASRDTGRYELELKKACVYKTGNPECRR